MKNSLFIILFFLLIGISCTTERDPNEKPVISASILPQKYLLDKIVLDKYEVNILIPTGASPASYEPSPQQINKLNDSKLYFRIGEIIFEKTWIEKIGIQNPDLKIVNLSKGISFLESEPHNHSADENHNHGSKDHTRDTGKDPHIWMSPKNMKLIAANLLESLIETFPSDASFFQTNYTGLLKEIESVDSLFNESAGILNAMDFLIYHPALGYLAKDYGMIQHVLEFEGKEPGPAYIASIIDKSLEMNIQYIFVQRQFSIENAKSLAKEINAEIIVIDPLGENWYQQMLEIHNTLISK